MQPTQRFLSIFLAVAVASTALGAAVTILVARPGSGESPQPLASDAGSEQKEQRLQALEEGQARVLAELEALQGEIRTLSQTSSRREDMDGSAALAGATESAGAPVAGASAREGSAGDLMERLLAADEDSNARAEVWQEARASGRTDALIALLEARSAESPRDPDRRVELGVAYLEKIQEVGAGQLAGVWATKADEAFDAALELDPQHWEARFTKAVALSFWPPVFGKKPAAIQEFERLRAQQAQLATEPQFAETYLLLGNLYRELGELDKARAAWKEGLSLFPDDSELAEQVQWSGN